MHKRTNPNPCCIYTEDCVVRAIAIATGKTWDEVYVALSAIGMEMCTPFTVNFVWGTYLYEQGYDAYDVAGACTVREFAAEHRRGIYLLGLGTHAVAVINGRYMDAWDSGDERVKYYFDLSRR